MEVYFVLYLIYFQLIYEDSRIQFECLIINDNEDLLLYSYQLIFRVLFDSLNFVLIHLNHQMFPMDSTRIK